jgi:prepilin-type N-terminal cleavage/methylation domain-containing protein
VHVLHQQEAIEVRSRIKSEDKNLIERGFTLVELLVVIVILGILAAVVVFAVGGITGKGNSSACKIEVRTVNTATQAFLAESTANPPAYPAGPVASLAGQLIAANLLPAGSNLTSSAGPANAYVPTYSATTGVYGANCP